MSSSFLQIFTEARLTNIDISTSDHCPVFFEPRVMAKPKVNRRFKFENKWLREPMCLQIIKETWDTYKHKTLHEKIALCAETLSR